MADGSGGSTINDVKSWIESMGQKGLYNSETARFRVTALERLISVMGADESQDPSTVLNDIDNLAKRWATKNNGTPGTAKAYASRAKGALTDFLNFQRDPTAFKGRRREEREEAEAKKSPTAEVGKASKSVPEAAAPDSSILRFPLGQGDVFGYVLPNRPLMTKDVRKIAFHLLTLAEDFDPAQSNVFGLVKTE